MAALPVNERKRPTGMEVIQKQLAQEEVEKEQKPKSQAGMKSQVAKMVV